MSQYFEPSGLPLEVRENGPPIAVQLSQSEKLRRLQQLGESEELDSPAVKQLALGLDRPMTPRTYLFDDLTSSAVSSDNEGQRFEMQILPRDRHDARANEPETRKKAKSFKRSRVSERSMGNLGRISSSDLSDLEPVAPRVQPVGSSAQMVHVQSINIEEGTTVTPERVYKVVFVGDSGVGKSSIIHRFYNNMFKASFSATIGVDFQVKTLSVDDHVIALQLWDTAGQERFRSITKQYFRKADGVVVVYDVTSESSFINVRNWMVNVKEGTADNCLLAILGNKVDMCESEESRVVKYKDGDSLAKSYNAMFFETSAKSGVRITDAFYQLARMLRDKEDEEIESALRLRTDEDTKSKKCCL